MTLFGVDAFTDRPFGGNPAIVCLRDRRAVRQSGSDPG
jgi:predicted PhzF superfamily epimerase YddE/YHI9